MPHPGHGKGHSLKGSSSRRSSSDSYMKGPSDDRGGEESSGETCQWCGAFMEEHGCQGWTDKVRIQLDSIGGPLCTAINYKHSPDFGYNTWIVCPDCAKAILELKEERSK